ncbi:hypothetical protein [Acinetobacter larvae]|uniref:Uncharacterized protein n=1 Tax=Acinetobacter larvae TaxID=1789224 RepID=A0A1B2LVZ6_9GAMM|nr:hypothetical protein [Acinetobacter larvae]AOA57122.1 hypothetical protein BFG52_01320 [Acinetobacter larvae]
MFKPFSNATDSHAVQDLTFENQGDSVNIYGNIQITKDQQGLRAAKVLQKICNDMVAQLEQVPELPAKIVLQEAQEIDNPFL